MQRKLKLNKPLLILLKLIVYSSLYYGCLWVLNTLLQVDNPSFAFLMTISVIIVFRGKFTEITQRIIDRSFYSRLYRLKQAASDFRREMNETLDYDELLIKSMLFMEKTFSPKDYLIYLHRDVAFEKVHHNDVVKDYQQSIPFTAEDVEDSPFEPAMQFYSLEQMWMSWPEYRMLIGEHIHSGHYRFFIPLKGRTQIVGFALFNDSIHNYLNVPEIRDFLVNIFRTASAVLENASTYSNLKRKSLEMELLLEVIQNITATLNLKDVLQGIIENLSLLVSFDAAAIFLLDSRQKKLMEKVSIGYRKINSEKIPLKLNEGIASWVIRNRESNITPDVRQSGHYFAVRPETLSQITVPIITQGNAIGVLVLESDEVEHFTHSDLRLLEVFSGMAAIAIRNAQLYGDSVKKNQLESDLLDASKVQKALLPRRVPTINGLAIDVFNIPSRIVGGDIYDVFRIGQSQQGIAIGDVSGKGAPAAMLMAVAYAGFKSLLKEIHPVVTVIARLNNFMVEAISTGHFLTFFYGVIDREKMTFTYSNAGHNPPILLRGEKEPCYLRDGGTVLGFIANQKYVQTTVNLQSGDYLCFYTDGVTEIMNAEEEEFGEERLAELMQENYGKPAKEVRQVIIDEVKKFASSTDFQDDLTLLIVSIE